MWWTDQAHEGIGIVLLLLLVLPAVALALGAELLAHAIGVHGRGDRTLAIDVRCSVQAELAGAIRRALVFLELRRCCFANRKQS